MQSLTLTLSGISSELSANYHPPIELDPNSEYVCGLVDFQSYMSIPNVTEKNNKFYYAQELHCRLPMKWESQSTEDVEALFSRQIKDTFSFSIERIRYVIAALGSINRGEIKTENKIEIRTEDNIITAWLEVKLGSVQVVFEYYKSISIPIGSYKFTDIVTYVNSVFQTTESRDFELDLKVNKNTLKCEVKSTEKILFNKSLNSIGSIFGFKDVVIKANTTYSSDDIVKISSTNVVKLETNITTGAYSNE